MKYTLLIIAILSIATADKWALFVSGAGGYSNYSVSSTVCRAYDVLHRSGMPEDHMIYFGFNSAFDSERNPFPGKIFTDASDTPGVDYAAECRPHMDYQDDVISAELFMAVLSGDKKTVTELTGIENPRVIESGPEDTVFVYYMDHGAIGFTVVGKSYLREEVLLETLNKMYDNKQYKQLVFYLEACHSGSMFRKLPADKNIYAMTGADTNHEAMECYCPPYDIMEGKHMGACMSAWYDNLWMSKVMNEGADIPLVDMYKYVHDETAKETEQNVSQFGDIDGMGGDLLSKYIGNYKGASAPEKVCEGSGNYADVALHLAKWNAIRATSNANDALIELKEAVKVESIKEVSVMRLARAYFKDDKAADNSLKSAPSKFDQDCVRDLTLGLIAQCGYELPLRDSHVNALKNICENGNVMMNFDLVC